MDDQSKGIDVPTEVRTREIRAEIDQTRGELTETVNAIQDRLRPGTLAADAAERVKNTVKQAAGDQARMVAETARDLADSEPVQYVRANPIPTAMVGIGVAGLAWLAFGGRVARPRYRSAGRTSGDWRRTGPYDDADRYHRSGAGRGTRTEPDAVPSAFGDAGFGEAGYPGQGGYETAAAYGPDLYQGVDRFESGGSARRPSRPESAAGDVSRSAADLGRRAQETGREAQQTLQRAWQQNPLVMGAASAVFGLLIGMAVPQTDVENEYMGEARDQALEGVQQTVRETVTKVQDAASNAASMLAPDATQPASAPPAVRNQEQTPAGVGQPAGTSNV